MTDAERIAALEQQVIYWRNQARSLNQLLQSTRNTAEKHTGRTITWADPTGNTAAARADKNRRRP